MLPSILCSFRKIKYDYPAEIADKCSQTIYRESDVQTLPWCPPYITNQSTVPEVVQFDAFNLGKFSHIYQANFILNYI